MKKTYIFDTEKGELSGPFSLEKYKEKISGYGIENMSEWIKTVPMPDGAE